jgi:hypothetical protein
MIITIVCCRFVFHSCVIIIMNKYSVHYFYNNKFIYRKYVKILCKYIESEIRQIITLSFELPYKVEFNTTIQNLKTLFIWIISVYCSTFAFLFNMRLLSYTRDTLNNLFRNWVNPLKILEHHTSQITDPIF